MESKSNSILPRVVVNISIAMYVCPSPLLQWSAIEMQRLPLFPGADHWPSKALLCQTKVIFRPLDIFWTCSHQPNLVTSLDLGGATMIFAQNWNFVLKLVFVNLFWKKMSSRWLGIYFLSKFRSKTPQDKTSFKATIR